MNKRQVIVLGVVAAVLVGGGFLFAEIRKLRVDVPAYQPHGQLIWASQGWTEAQRLRFHHTAQGTRLVRYSWFMALEQPCFSLFSACEPFAAEAYLGRFGFLPSKADPELNPDGLPIGFAKQADFYDPMNKQTYPVAGLTCAACHTGALQYGDYTVQVDGAPAMIEVTQFQKALGVSMALTQLIPFRYGRFEKRVLGADASAEKKRELKDAFDYFMKVAKAEKKATEELAIYKNEAGFIRTDALTRIGNQVFAVDMQNDNNFAKSSAPVRFPQIWNSSWFNWVQYNSSISDPMIRNIGEALGVRAVAKLYGNDAGQFENSVHVEGLKALEDLLAGSAPFQGLASPKWPAVFPALHADKVRRGAALYQEHCQACHLPAPSELVADLNSAQPVHWWKNRQNKLFLIVKDVGLDYVGTDPHEAMDFLDRKADTGSLNKGRVTAGEGLELVTRGIAANFFRKAGFSPDKQVEWSGFRDPKDEAVRAKPIYKARPLNGVWAVAPYLHNGSVPNLYELLSPQAERSTKFWLGSKKFDPVKVGYDTAELKGGYLYDVAQPGNSNKGHEFNSGPKGKGIIGPLLPPEDRWALIEYLKSIEEPAKLQLSASAAQ